LENFCTPVLNVSHNRGNVYHMGLQLYKRLSLCGSVNQNFLGDHPRHFGFEA